MLRAGVTKEKIFKLSEKISNKEGYENLTMGHLARELGIKTPSLYKHVSDLEEIQEYLAVRGLSLLRFRLESLSHFSDIKYFNACVLEYRRFALENPGLYAAFQKTHVNRSTAVQLEAKKILDLIFRMLLEINIKKKDLISAARALRSCIHGFITLEKSGGFGMPEDLNKSFSYMIKIFIRGMSDSVK